MSAAVSLRAPGTRLPLDPLVRLGIYNAHTTRVFPLIFDTKGGGVSPSSLIICFLQNITWMFIKIFFWFKFFKNLQLSHVSATYYQKHRFV